MPSLRARLERHLHILVEEVGARPPGSPANRRACDHAAAVLRAAGLEVVEHPFTTRWWEPGPGWIETTGGRVEATPDPYSVACDVRGHALRVATAEALEGLVPAEGRILVLHDELTREQLTPEAFPFLDPAAHAAVRSTLARLHPPAVISLTDHWEPILEDPDLGLASTTLPTAADVGLADGAEVRVVLGGTVHEGTGRTVTALSGPRDGRLVLSAHLDAKATTPGAFDNAGSVAVLLALAEQGLEGLAPVEVVLFNGEDHFDACGEVAWLAATDLSEVAANLNLDGIGLAGGGTSVASLSCPPALAEAVCAWVDRRPGWWRAEPWIESDHALFALAGIPALALTSEDVHALLGGIAHTPRDTLDVLDLDLLVDVATALPELAALLREVDAARSRAPGGSADGRRGRVAPR